jgi:type I restriction enzyme S subunit
MEREATGASGSMQNISQDTVKNLILVKPPLNVQYKIIQFVERKSRRALQLIETVQEGINRMNEYRTALISAAVTGKIHVRGEVAEGEAEAA